MSSSTKKSKPGSRVAKEKPNSILQRKATHRKPEKVETEEERNIREAKEKEDKRLLFIHEHCTILDFLYLDKDKNKSISN